MNTTAVADDGRTIYTLYHAIEENCPSDARIDVGYFSFWEIWVLNLLVFLAESLVGVIFACVFSSDAAPDAATREKKRLRRAKVTRALLGVHCAMLFACTCWYLRHGVPRGAAHPTCPFVYLVCLPLYKPAAGPLWRLVMMLVEGHVPGMREDRRIDDDGLGRGASYVGYALALLALLMLGFGAPLMLVFLPATLLLLLLCALILALTVLFAFPCFVCGSMTRRSSEGFMPKFVGTLWHQSAFLLVGLLAYVCAVFGPFYQRPGLWVRLLRRSWLYVEPGALVYQTRELLRWPADMAFGAQAILGASLATIAIEFALLTGVAACALARVDGQVRTGAELAQIPIEAVQPA